MFASRRVVRSLTLTLVLACTVAAAYAQTPPAQPALGAKTGAPVPAAAATTGVALPADYVIGPEDVLGVLFWREQDMSGDVTVRPDGMITLPLIGEIRAAGMKPDALHEVIGNAATKFLSDPNVTVVVKQINSRKVFITGMVNKPGTYPLTGPRTVMHIIAEAGGLMEYADSESISILRDEQGKTRAFKFNYKDVAKGKKLQHNIQLQPNDTVVVP